MISALEQSDIFAAVSSELKRHNLVLFDAFAGEGTEWAFEVSDDAFADGFDTSRLYFIKQGKISLYHNNNKLYTLAEGNILFPTQFRPGTSPHFRYVIEEKIKVTTFSTTELADLIGNRQEWVSTLLEISAMSQFLLIEAIANQIEAKE